MTNEIKSKLVQRIERIDGFKDVGIMFIGNSMCHLVKEPKLSQGMRAWVVIEEVQNTPSQKFEPRTEVKKKSSENLKEELFNTGINCGGAVLAGAVAVGSAAAIPVSGGASGIVTVLSYSAAGASAAQCGLSIGRIINEFIDPAINETYLDSNLWYQRVSDLLDGIALAGALVDIGKQATIIVKMSRSSGKSIKQILKGLNRADRKQLTKEIAAWRKKADTPAKFKKLVRAGNFPKLFKRHEVTAAMKNALVSAVGDVITFAGSSYSGNLNGFIVYITSD